ncbi:MAG: group I intron-associated PD-(D/E)XK endonuclease [Terriglobales bacterium]
MPYHKRDSPANASFRHPKKQGEWAELAFMTRAAALGLNVSKPWGDSARYDFIVEFRGRIFRVQVKSTARPHRQRSRPTRAYCINSATGSNRQLTYTRADADFLAAYIVPEDLWYIIPVRAILGRRTLRLSPHHPRRRGRYEKYQEAWSLLWRTTQPRRGGI